MSHPTSIKKVQRSWAMYDWANSAYNLVITSTIFPAYYEGITSVKAAGLIVDDQVQFFGWQLSNTALFDYAVAFAYLIIAILSPILSSIADVRGNKKAFMRFFCYLGAIACGLMYFFERGTLEFGIICFVLAAIGYCGSLVFYNAFLPEISTMEERDKVSAQGFAYGYIGSVILQLICFVFVMKADWFGADEAWGSRFSFLLVGIWWIVFAQISMRGLPAGKAATTTDNKESIFTKGFKELHKVWQQVQGLPALKWYLAAFFFYSMGVQTVMLAATLFGSKELQLDTAQLIISILIIQLIAIAGAYIMSFLSKRFGNIPILAMVVVIWIGVCIWAYFIQTAMQFYLIAATVGIIMGGIQSLSRSTYTKLMPETKDTTSFFSFYDVMEKVAIVFGMFSFGFIEHMSGSMRNSIIALVIFFLIGFLLLLYTNSWVKRHRPTHN